MSFLLDALRKSEDQKRKGPVPTIHGGQHPTAETSRRPAVVLYALLVLLPLLLVFAWYLTREPAGGVGSEIPVPAQAASGQAGNGRAADPKATATQTGNEQGLSRKEPDRSVAARPALSVDRTPVEQYDPPPGAQAGGATRSSNPTRAAADRQPVLNDPGLTASPQAQLTPAEPVRGQSSSASEARPTPAANDTLMPGMVTFWELPGSVRNDIMEMHISVMVFAERPEDRFILMNGRRWEEGDEPQEGLRIEEIRREGVVFTFRRYRFLVAQ